MIKHLSFDFWNTLGIANKTFARIRSEILSDFSESDGYFEDKHNHTPEYCRAAYTAVKQEMDGYERNGAYFSTDTCYERLMDHLEIELPYHLMALMKARIWQAFVNFPPTILPETVAELKRLKAKGYTMSIGSNTNFIPGQVIIDCVLKQLEVFDFYIFSDAIGCSKPVYDFFAEVELGAHTLYDDSHIKLAEILHIGDSERFDKFGAEYYGMPAHLITGPEALPQFLQTL